MKTIYGQPSCLKCKDLMRTLDEKKEVYNYIDITKDREALTKLHGLGVTHLPYVEE